MYLLIDDPTSFKKHVRWERTLTGAYMERSDVKLSVSHLRAGGWLDVKRGEKFSPMEQSQNKGIEVQVNSSTMLTSSKSMRTQGAFYSTSTRLVGVFQIRSQG